MMAELAPKELSWPIIMQSNICRPRGIAKGINATYGLSELVLWNTN